MRIDLPQVLGSQAREARRRRHLTFLAVAVHLREEGGIAEPARIGINGRRFYERAARIRDTKLIDDGSVPQEFRERLALGAVGHGHHCSIAPVQHFGVMPSERIRVSSGQGVERRASLIILREKSTPARNHCESNDQANLRHNAVSASAQHAEAPRLPWRHALTAKRVSASAVRGTTCGTPSSSRAAPPAHAAYRSTPRRCSPVRPIAARHSRSDCMPFRDPPRGRSRL